MPHYWIELYDSNGALQEKLTCIDAIHAVTVLGAFAARNSVFDFVTASCWSSTQTEQWTMEIK